MLTKQTLILAILPILACSFCVVSPECTQRCCNSLGVCPDIFTALIKKQPILALLSVFGSASQCTQRAHATFNYNFTAYFAASDFNAQTFQSGMKKIQDYSLAKFVSKIAYGLGGAFIIVGIVLQCLRCKLRKKYDRYMTQNQQIVSSDNVVKQVY